MRWDDILPFMLGALAIMIPIIAIVLSHQRRMAEITLNRQSSQQASENFQHEEVMKQLKEMRQTMSDLALHVDDRVDALSQRVIEMERRTLGH